MRHGSERFDLAEVAVIHPDEVEAALVVSHQEPRQVSVARQEDFQHWIGRGMGKGRVGLAVALDDVGDGETPHAVLSVAPCCYYLEYRSEERRVGKEV